MNHHYGASADYDLLAEISGDSGWSWKNIRKYIKTVSSPHPSGIPRA